ncbi:MAG: hypothetical protein ACKOWX_03295 [Flavobacteriales bacterium]
MYKRLLLALLFLISLSHASAQSYVGFGAALHRYDQVLSIKGVKMINSGGFGLELGCGIERSLQGALAPQFALFWQAPMTVRNRQYSIARPIYSLRYQFDFQQASILDTYHGIYGGLGYSFSLGVNHFLLLQLGLGAVVENMYFPNTSNTQQHFLINPQVQLNYYIKMGAK